MTDKKLELTAMELSSLQEINRLARQLMEGSEDLKIVTGASAIKIESGRILREAGV